MDNVLLAILACPLCKGNLVYDQTHEELICHVDHLAYPIRNHVPVMLPDEARDLRAESI